VKNQIGDSQLTCECLQCYKPLEIERRELNDQLGWDLQDEDVDTIAGYVMKTLERTARVGDVIDSPYGRIRVENMAQVRITQVAILPTPTAAQEVSAGAG